MTSPWHVSLILLLVFSSSVNVRSQATIEHDVIFFIDGSLSVTYTNFLKQINAVFAKYIDQWPVSEEGVHVGFIAYSSQLDVVHLNGNTTELEQKSQNLIYEGRASNAHLAFEQALTMFMSAHSIRSGSVQSIIMLTDGTARLPLDTRTAAEACRDYGVNIYVIGIGSNVRVLESLWYTGNISRVYNNDTFDDVLPQIDIGLPAAVPTSVTSTVVASTGIQSSQSTSTVSPSPGIDSSWSTQTAQTSTSTQLNPSSSSINLGSTSTSTQLNPSSSSINFGSTSTSTQLNPSSSSINLGSTSTSTPHIPSSSSINLGSTSTSTPQIPSSSLINLGSTSTSTPQIPSSSLINFGSTSTSTPLNPSSSLINVGSTSTSTPQIPSSSSINFGSTSTSTQLNPSSSSIIFGSTSTSTPQIPSSSSINFGSTSTSTPQIPSSSLINFGSTSTSTPQIPSSSSINFGSTSTSTPQIPSSSLINFGSTSTSTQPIPSSSSINLSPTTASTQPFPSSPSIKYSTTTAPTQVIQSSSSMWSSTTLATLQSTSTSTTPPTQSPYTTLPLTTIPYNHASSLTPSRSDPPLSSTRLASTGYPHMTTSTPMNSGSIVPTSTYSVTPTASTRPDDGIEDVDNGAANVTDEAGICARAVQMNGFMFAPHPDDCDKFIQCHVSHDRRITASVRACPRGLFWNQAKFACDKPEEECNRECRDPCRGKDDGDTYKMEGGCGLFWECVDGVAQGRSCKPRYAFIPGHGCVYRPECRYVDIRRRRCDATCDLTPNEDNTKFIIPLKTGWLTSSCLFGTEFDLASCSCRANENFDKDCPYMAWMDGASEAYNTTSDNNDTSVAPAEPTCESRVLIHQDSNRPLAIRFRYRYSDDGDGDDVTSSPQAQVLVRSRECQKGGTCSLVDDGSNLSLEIVSGNGIFVSSSIPLLGLNQTAWRDVRVVYSKGEITMEITVGQLTYTSYIKGDPHVQVGVCGWEVGKAGDLENYGDFTGDIQQVQISRCFDYGI